MNFMDFLRVSLKVPDCVVFMMRSYPSLQAGAKDDHDHDYARPAATSDVLMADHEQLK
jgi:hypothetical protein